MKPYEPFTAARGGLTIRGCVWRSDDAVHPAVILCHGFLSDQNSCRAYAELLNDMGYTAYTFDFCGGGVAGTSDGRTEDMTLLTEVEDLEQVIAAVRADPRVSTLTLFGCSQGGFVCALTAKRHPELAALVLFYPALCIPDDARAGNMRMMRFDPHDLPPLLTEQPMRIGRAYAATVMDWDYREVIRGYAGKTLLVHGTADEIVDVSYARGARSCFPDCRYYEIEGGAHGFRGEYEQQAFAILRQELAL